MKDGISGFLTQKSSVLRGTSGLGGARRPSASGMSRRDSGFSRASDTGIGGIEKGAKSGKWGADDYGDLNIPTRDRND